MTPYAYACPAQCGCLWRENRDGSISLFGPKSQSCNVCEPMPLAKLVPLYRNAAGVMVVGALATKPPCTVCGTAYEKHGSYPTCASHPYTPDGNCQHVPGALCVGAECRNGCVRGRGVAGVAVAAGEVFSEKPPSTCDYPFCEHENKGDCNRG